MPNAAPRATPLESIVLTPRRHEAVIFDLDGVVTRTARLHAAAWKDTFDAFLAAHGEGDQAPFDAVEEYRRTVDGKPRYDGVRSFLAARGIALPEGHPDDAPDARTVCGLGNQKNARFLERLSSEGAEAFPSTLTLIRALRRAGVRTAVVSSSRNCRAVLESVDALGLFDATLDGVDAERLRLAGKPAPDLFLAAARALGVSPQRAVVVEDALAGVAAARAGGFGLVIGVDRAGQAEALALHGADVVVSDLAEVTLEAPAARPSALASLNEIAARIGARRIAVFLDYDGTLTPIVDRPEDARLSESMRATVHRLAARCTVSIISGRDLADVRARVAVPDIWYAGSHGFDLAGPGGEAHAPPGAAAAGPDLDAAERRLRGALADVPGALLERKRYGLAVHYRLAEAARAAEIEAAVDAALAASRRLRKTRGKKVFELLPDIAWDKGAALCWLQGVLAVATHDVSLYLGDDATDEDAFRALRGSDIGIAVLDAARPTAADYLLADCGQVERFLVALAKHLESRA